MYRERTRDDFDSGWRFFSGLESDDYANDPENVGIYEVNTIANYDPAIIPLLDAPTGSAFGRDVMTRVFVEEEFSPPGE